MLNFLTRRSTRHNDTERDVGIRVSVRGVLGKSPTNQRKIRSARVRHGDRALVV